MATSLEESKKEAQIDKVYETTFYLVKKIVKVGLVDPEIIGLRLKKKLWKEKYIARSASLRSGLNKAIYCSEMCCIHSLNPSL